MEAKCYYKGCKKPTEIFCGCRNDPTFLCGDHLDTHCQSNSSHQHSTHSIYVQIPAVSKSKLVQIFHDKLKSLQTIQKNLQYALNTLLKEIHSMSKSLNKTLSKQINCAESFLIDAISKNRFYSPHRDLGNNSINFKDFTNEFNIINDNKVMVSKAPLITKLTKILDNIFSLFPVPEIRKYNNTEITTKFYTTCVRSRSLIGLDLIKHESFQVNLNIMNDFGYGCIICMLPNQRLFVSGGFLEGFQDTTNVIDLKTSSAKTYKTSKNRCWAGPVYYKQKVYVFGGGTEESKLNSSEYFNLKTSKWIPVSNLPSSVTFTNTLLIDQRVLIAGFENFFCNYEILLNKFTSVLSSMIIGKSSIFILDNEKVLLFMNNAVFYSSVSNVNCWKAISKINLFDPIISKSVIRGRTAYFSDWNSTIYFINLDTYDIRKLSAN